MEPDKFRKSRQAINRMCDNIYSLIEEKDLEASKECHEEVSSKLEVLVPQAEGEIQERSVKNLGVKLSALSTHISKLKPKKGVARKSSKPAIVWDEDLVGQLAPAFLKKVLANMGDDKTAKVCFGTTGKGIRPSYQIEFSDQKKTSFSGSSHSPAKKQLSAGANKVSDPFSRDIIESTLNKK